MFRACVGGVGLGVGVWWVTAWSGCVFPQNKSVLEEYCIPPKGVF